MQDTSRPVWIVGPIDQEINEGESFLYQLSVFNHSDILAWTLNDTTYFTISDDGLISNSSSLEPGVYGLGVTVRDFYNNELVSSFSVTVLETHDTPTTTTTTTTTTATTTTSETTPTDIPLIIAIVGVTGAAAAVIVIVLLIRNRGWKAGRFISLFKQ